MSGGKSGLSARDRSARGAGPQRFSAHPDFQQSTQCRWEHCQGTARLSITMRRFRNGDGITQLMEGREERILRVEGPTGATGPAGPGRAGLRAGEQAGRGACSR